MQDGKKEKIGLPRIWVGFGIGAAVSSIAYSGIAGLIFLIEQFQLPEEELVIFTSLFYGIIFFVALGGVRAESRRYKMLVARRPFETPPPPASRARETMGRIRTVLWYVFSLFSLGWLTPALIIYWTEPKHPDWAVSVCAYLFSLFAGTVYVLKRSDKIRTGYNYAMLYVGVALGAFVVNRIFGILQP